MDPRRVAADSELIFWTGCYRLWVRVLFSYMVLPLPVCIFSLSKRRKKEREREKQGEREWRREGGREKGRKKEEGEEREGEREITGIELIRNPGS